jgi:hypothetical protein
VGYVNEYSFMVREIHRQAVRQAGLSIYINNCVLKALVAQLAGQQATWKVRFRRGERFGIDIKQCDG